MATQQLIGGRRSSAPVIQPRAALATGVNDTELLLKKLASGLAGVAAPTQVFAPSEVISSGSSYQQPATTPKAGDAKAAQQFGSIASTGGQGLSALGVLMENPGLMEAGSMLGKMGSTVYAGGSLAGGDIGSAARAFIPNLLSLFDVPAPLAAAGMVATGSNGDVRNTPQDIAARMTTAALTYSNPAVAAINGLSKLFGGPTIDSILGPSIKGALTPVEVAQPSNYGSSYPNFTAPATGFMGNSNLFDSASPFGTFSLSGGDSFGSGYGDSSSYSTDEGE